jgi:glyoxylate reductase
LPEGDRYVRGGEWKTWGPLLLLGPDVHGATIGIVGFGRIGQAVARRAQGFGMEILYHDVQQLPPEVTQPLGATYLPLEQLLARSDFVSLHVNLSDVTRHLINAQTLSWMKPTAVLVNTSRGPVVDQRALADALHGPGAHPHGRPARGPRQLPHRPAHRVGVAGDARQDGRDGRCEPARRRPWRTASDRGAPARRGRLTGAP